MLQPTGNLIESRWMARHQHKQCPRMSAANDTMRFEHSFFLSGVRAASHPHRPRRRVKLPELPAARSHVVRHAEVELNVSGDMRSLGISTQGFEAVRITFALSRHDNSA